MTKLHPRTVMHSHLPLRPPMLPAAYAAFRAWLDGRDIPKPKKQVWSWHLCLVDAMLGCCAAGYMVQA